MALSVVLLTVPGLDCDERDTLGEFMLECCLLRSKAEVSSQNLHEEYKRWANHSGERTWSRKRFAQGMERRGGQPTRQPAMFLPSDSRFA